MALRGCQLIPLRKISLKFGRAFLVVIGTLILHSSADAASVTLSWIDNSGNESGFKVERKTGTSGTYAQIGTVGVNVRTYTDSTVAAGTTYCYRVRAFNNGGDSAYSNDACGTVSTGQSFSLTVTKTGTASGTVTSNPAGINCGADCSEVYSSGTTVNLAATAAAGSRFSGWMGDADCSDASLSMTGNRSCTAIFSLENRPP